MKWGQPFYAAPSSLEQRENAKGINKPEDVNGIRIRMCGLGLGLGLGPWGKQ